MWQDWPSVQEESLSKLCISRSQRTKRKSVTVVVGLKTFGKRLDTVLVELLPLPVVTDIDIKKASKMFAQHYSCGSSVTGEDEIVVQGDVYDDIVDFVKDKWPKASCP